MEVDIKHLVNKTLSTHNLQCYFQDEGLVVTLGNDQGRGCVAVVNQNGLMENAFIPGLIVGTQQVAYSTLTLATTSEIYEALQTCLDAMNKREAEIEQKLSDLPRQ